MAPMKKVADTVEKHLEDILAHWINGWLSTGLMARAQQSVQRGEEKSPGLPQQRLHDHDAPLRCW
jgi:hypothetical protein